MPCSHRACASGELPDAEGPPAFCGRAGECLVRTEHALRGGDCRTHRRTHAPLFRDGPARGTDREPRRTAGSPGGRPGQGAPGLTVHATQPRQPVPTALSRHEAPGGQPEKSTPTDSPCHAAPAAEHGRKEARHGSGTQCRRRAMLRGTMPQNDRAPESSATDSGARPVFAAATARHAPPPAAPRRSAAPCHTRGGRRAAGCDRA